MAKRVTGFEMLPSGTVVTFKGKKITRAMRKTEQRLIPLTPAPRTRAQRLKRWAVG